MTLFGKPSAVDGRNTGNNRRSVFLWDAQRTGMLPNEGNDLNYLKQLRS